MASNPWGLTVKLVPHIGIADTPLGPTEVKVPQWSVMVDSRQIEMNYGTKPGRGVEAGMAGFETTTIEFMAHTNTWPPEAKGWICEEVGRMTNSIRRNNSPVLPRAPKVEDLDEVIDVSDLDEIED
jgi:hypothetical protein